MPDLKIALFGGIYNNYLALQALIVDARRRGASRVFFLGDTGGFGPFPDRSVEMLRSADIQAIAGNYDVSIGAELADCGCGYTDPRDNHYARISYDYTLANTSVENRRWLAGLPTTLRLNFAGKRLLLVHGSPRRLNEFLWESTTSSPYIARLCEEYAADLVCCTHTGLYWQRRLADGRGIVNVGAIGRPANDGNHHVWYTLLHVEKEGIRVEFVPLHYDWERLGREMEGEGLPPEFVETVRTGWWTTCLEILPPKERGRGEG